MDLRRSVDGDYWTYGTDDPDNHLHDDCAVNVDSTDDPKPTCGRCGDDVYARRDDEQHQYGTEPRRDESGKERFAKRSAHAFWRNRIAMFPWLGVDLILQIVRWPLSFYLIWYVSNLMIEGHLTVGDYGALYGMYMGLQ